VPNTLQYPLERHRDVQRKWQRLLQRTSAPKVYAPIPLKALADSGIREDANEHGGARQSDELRPVLLRAITH
jgi:hypothetical protein